MLRNGTIIIIEIFGKDRQTQLLGMVVALRGGSTPDASSYVTVRSCCSHEMETLLRLRVYVYNALFLFIKTITAL